MKQIAGGETAQKHCCSVDRPRRREWLLPALMVLFCVLWEHAWAQSPSRWPLGWGDNWHGQLGDGTTDNRVAPVTVWGLSTGVAIAAGNCHSLAVSSM